MKEEITEFGKVFYYDYQNYHFALYIYDDDDETIYLSNVKVDAEERGKGFGNKILEITEAEARKRNVSIICLKCLITSWVHSWYCNRLQIILKNIKIVWNLEINK